MGELSATADGRVSFVYDDEWREDARTFPLSLSMSKVVKRHGGGVVSNWLWNLLPENVQVIERIAQDTNHGWKRVSPRNPLALLSKVGEECAGAIQLLAPERLAAAVGSLKLLTEADVAVRLRELRQNRAASGRLPDDQGQFSLAGAQTKTALHRTMDGTWALPSGRIATTHIFKPPIPTLHGQVENEHLCLKLGAALGIPFSRSEVMRFGDERAIVVERYDRLRQPDGTVVRLHQEDMCQVLALSPNKKYQENGGPGLFDVLTKVLSSSGDPGADRDAFVRATAMNFIMLGTDAHAKNFSVLFGGGPVYRLAPIYDVNSYLPYADRPSAAKLSMSVDGNSYIGEIHPRHWEKQARACQLPTEVWIQAIRDMIVRAPDLASAIVRNCRAEGLEHDVMDKMVNKLAVRCTLLATAYGAEQLPGTDPASVDVASKPQQLQQAEGLGHFEGDADVGREQDGHADRVHRRPVRLGQRVKPPSA